MHLRHHNDKTLDREVLVQLFSVEISATILLNTIYSSFIALEQ